jgi:hypothetical protein
MVTSPGRARLQSAALGRDFSKLQRDARGIEALPMVLLLGTVLGACTLGIGIRCLGNVQNLTEVQQAVDGFNVFVERVKIVCAGGEGNVQQIELNLPVGSIVVEGELLQLVVDGEVRESELLSLPIIFNGYETWKIASGLYEIELERNSFGDYYIDLRGTSHG